MTFFYRKIFLQAIVLAGFLSTNIVAQRTQSAVKNVSAPIKKGLEWNVSPFDNKVFIENKGQFDISDISKDKVLYSATIGSVQLYFTSHSILYSYNEYSKDATEKPIARTLVADWKNANNNVTISAEHGLSYAYHYPSGKSNTIIAGIYRKIIYRNLYPGIDVEFYFPDKKEGFEYDIVVHPGADISQVKLAYGNATNPIIDSKGNVLTNTVVGEITDHTPSATAADGGTVKVKYIVNGNEEGLQFTGTYDKTKTITIDPWTTNPKFTGTCNKAYDLDYDVNGNVYVYGGYTTFQLVKLNSAGTIQWAFPAGSIDGAIYGGLAVDPKSGTSYLIEGARAAGVRILKVNSAGILVTTSGPDANMNEMWRPLFNTCNNNLVIGAGGTKAGANTQATLVDTSFTTFTNVNVLGATAAGHSMVLATMDPSGASCYMAVAKSAVIDPKKFNNVLVKLPLPSLSPNLFSVPDGYKFVELASINYVGNGIGATNGMNGMSASLNWLYLYDGGELRRFDKKTGALKDSVKVTSDPYSWGGLAADICDNIYVGSKKWISVYNSSLILADTITLPDTVYDVKVDASRQVVLACGKGFVRSVNVPFSPLSIAGTNATCSCNGIATANLCGGADTSNVTYLWSNGKTTQTISGLCGGKYKVTVTLGGCVPVKYIDSINIIQPTPLVATITSKANVKCNGGVGNATVTVTGGSKPYKYSWTPSGGTNALADSLFAGSYTVTVTDSNKCTATTTVLITQPPVFTDTATGNYAHCGKSDGKAIATVTGGASPYVYAWSPGGQTKASATNLTAGTYVSTVTDANGCTVSSVIIIPDSGVSASISGITAEKCFGQSTGSATVSMTGGKPGYTYSWSPGGQTNATAVNLSSVLYIASVKDANGCIASDTVTILQPPKLVINMEAVNVGCTGGSTGSVTAATSGGTSPYTYSWSNGGTDSTISGLDSGRYSVTVIDINGCSAKDTSTITQPAKGLTTVVVSSKGVSCNGGKNGTATDSSSGGTAPYSINWGIPGDTTATADSLSAGTYVVTVTDANGCSATTSIAIAQPSAALADTIISTNNKCFGDSNGTAFVIPSGGTKPYTYLWSPVASTTDTIVKLPAGTYNVSITDSNKCNGAGSVTITQPAHLIIGITTTPTPCNKNNGSATAIVSGEPYTFSWKPGSNTSAKDSGLAAGTYTVTVTDTSGCKTDTAAIVPHSIPPKVTASSIPATCDSSNGSAIAHATGGVGSYTYSWKPGVQTGDTATRIGPGIYTVTVSDSNGCKDTAITIVGDSGVSTSFGNISDISCFGLTNGSATANMVGGTSPFNYSWSDGQTTSTANNLSVGTYTVIITDVHNCTVTDTIKITQPALLTAAIPQANIKNVSCFGDSNGSAFPNVAGGTKPYSYVWTDGEKTDTANALPAGTYTVTVTDKNLCVTSATAIITQPLPLTVTTSTTAATCGNNGSATGAAHGGTTPYSYTWGGGFGAGVTISAIGPGLYTVTATDSNGCTATDTARVIHSGQTANISASHNVKCFGGNNGSATVSVIGGDTLLYGYQWTGGQTNATASNLVAGVDTVFVTYIANGCTDTVYDTITQPSKLNVTYNDTVKCNSATANVQVNATGGVPGYTYSWNGTTGTNANVSIPGGPYTLVVTDKNGCTDTLKTTLNVSILSAFFRPEPDTILGGEFIYFKNLSAGANSAWWSFGNGNYSDSLDPYQQYGTAGKYVVYLYVTNAKGCRDSFPQTVYVIEDLFVPNVFTPNGDGINDAFHVSAGNMKEYALYIYNRWGEKIFESYSPNIDWTGTSDAGVPYPDGTYYYILKATDFENKVYQLHGYLELIR